MACQAWASKEGKKRAIGNGRSEESVEGRELGAGQAVEGTRVG